MSFFNFKTSGLFNTNYAKEAVEKVVKVFGNIEELELKKDKGTSVLEPGERKNIFPGSTVGAAYYGNVARYINYEESNKAHKLSIYRQMSEYPEIFYALNTITDEIVSKDENGTVAELNIENEELLKNINKKENLMREWEYIYYDVCDFDREARDMVFQYLVTGEIFVEKIVNPNRLDKGILRCKRLLPDNTFILYNIEGDIEKYVIKSFNGTTMTIPKPEIAYRNHGQFAFNRDTQEKITLSYLEPLKKVWRQLQLLEEAVVIYRIVRAPERRIFRIATGNMPKAQAESYIQQLMKRYRQKKLYNTSTGEIDGQANILSMLEDYWFSQPETGQGSTVDTLPGGDHLDQLADVEYFLKKLYRAMQIPESRRLDTGDGGKATIGQLGDVTHSEIKFTNLTNNMALNVKDILFDIYKTHLMLKGYWKQYGLKDRDFNIKFCKNNHYEEFKKAQITETKLANFGVISAYIGQTFSKEFACRHFLGLTEDQWLQNKKQMETEKQDDGQMPPLQGGF